MEILFESFFPEINIEWAEPIKNIEDKNPLRPFSIWRVLCIFKVYLVDADHVNLMRLSAKIRIMVI